MKKATRSTIIFGIISALGVIPLFYWQATYWAWPLVHKIYLFTNLAIYSVLLCKWSKTQIQAIAFPLFLLAGVAIWPQTHIGFILLALAIFSWIRSGICFDYAPIRAILGECITLVGGVGFIFIWWPNTTLVLPLAIWFFFLVQSLYFFFLPAPLPDNEIFSDRFEQANREIERVFENG